MTRPLRPVPLAAAVLAVVALLLSGCGGDDDAAGPATTTTTEADGTETTDGDAGGDDDDPAADDPGDDPGGNDTAPDETSTTAAPPVAGPEELRALLLTPDVLGDGLSPDETFGDGTFSPDLCEDVILDVTWEDQASQALSTGTGAEDTSLTQAVLTFADAGAAEAFAAALVEGYQTCLAQGTLEEVDTGEGAARHVVETEGITTTDAAVRVGARVTVLRAVHPTGVTALDDDVLAAAGARLAG